MTPEMARKYLAKNESNRNLRPKKVAEYRMQMEKGYWHLTPQGISISTEGRLLNGQHRLQAVVEYGKPVPMVITTGVEPGTQQYMDSGAPRRIADNLKMFDDEKNTTQLVALCRGLNLFDTGILEPIVLDDARKILKSYRTSVDWAQSLPQRPLPRTAYFFAPMVWIHKFGWADEVAAFADEMATLAGLERGSPVIALFKAIERRSKMAGGGAFRSIGLALMTFNALRAYMEDEELTSRSLHATPGGFDYFNILVKDIDTKKARRGETCRWGGGCDFKMSTAPGKPSPNGVPNKNRRCWLHTNFSQKRRG
jgi:hypothetical protein